MKTMMTVILVLLVSVMTGFSNANENEYAKWFQQGIDSVKKGDLEAAKQRFAMALVCKPDDPEASKGLAMSEERLNRKPTTLQAQNEGAADLDENHIMSGKWYQKGIIYVKRGDLRRASISFENALEYNPDNTNARQGFEVTEQRLAELGGKNPSRVNPRRHSFRVSVGSAPGIDKESDADSVSPDGGMQIEVMHILTNWGEENARFGFLYGYGGFFAYNKGVEATGEAYTGGTVGIMGQMGLAARIGDHVVVELSPYLGLGAILPSWHYGIKGGVHVVSEKLGIGVEVGYGGFNYTVSSGNGPRVALVASFNF